MQRYLVEAFVAQNAAGGCTAREWRARSVVGELRRQGVRVRFDRAFPVPESELCVFVFEAASDREAALAAELAQLDPYRIVAASTAKLGTDVG